MTKGWLKYGNSRLGLVGLVCLITACTAPENAEIDQEGEPPSQEEDQADSQLGEITGAVGVSVGVLGSLGSSDQDNQKEQTLSFETIESGTQSNIRVPRNVVINSQEDWQTLWIEHQLGSVEIPEIDFTIQTVIGMYAGERSSGGYTLAIDHLGATGKILTVSALESIPGTGCTVTLALTSPYHLIQIPKTDKAVEFSTQSQVKPCQE